MLATSYIKAHGTQCSEENAGNMTETTILVCIAVQAAIQQRVRDKRCKHNGGAIGATFVLRALQEEHTDFEYIPRVVQ